MLKIFEELFGFVFVELTAEDKAKISSMLPIDSPVSMLTEDRHWEG